MKSDRPSSSVRRKDPKGGIWGERNSDPKPTKDKTEGRHLKRSWSRALPERAESHIQTSGGRDREGREKVAEERGAAPPGCL